MGITSLTATQTTVMENMINMMTNFIESYCGRRFMQTAYTSETYDGPQSETLLLKNYPISTTATFALYSRDSSANEDEWEEIDSTDYFIYYDEGYVNLTGRDRFNLYNRKYKVDYTAGYDFDNAATFLSDTVAGDLEMAVWMMVAQQWLTKGSSGLVKGERLGDYSVTYGGGSDVATFLKDGSGQGISLVQATLDKYRRTESETYLTPDNTKGTFEE